MPDHRADRAGRRGDQHRFPRLRRDDPVQPVPGGDSGHAERAKIRLDRRGLRIDGSQALAIAKRIKLPAAARGDDRVARMKARIVGGFDNSGSVADHHRADLLGLGVGFRVAQPPAHIGVERQERMPHQHLVRPRRRNWRLDNPEVGGRDLVGRPVVEQNLEIASQSGAPVDHYRSGCPQVFSEKNRSDAETTNKPT